MNYQTTNIQQKKSERLLSLDALRGFDMFWIVCGEGIFHGFANAVMEKHRLTRDLTDWNIKVEGDLSFFERIVVGVSNQLHHTVWNGFTFYDLIFPLFIFVAGVSMPFSFENTLAKAGVKNGIGKKKILYSLLKRTIILILLGMVVNGALQLNGYENTRFASVLGRIALSCFFAGLIVLYANFRWQIFWFGFFLIGY